MNAPKPDFLVPAGLASCALATVLVLGAGSCSRPSPEDQRAANGPRAPATHQEVVDGVFGPGSPQPADPAYPVVPFRRSSLGLPTKGTWREHPLLHDFTGNGRADLVASNREEDGLSTWRAPDSDGGAWELRIEGIARDLMYGGSAGGDLNGDGHDDLVFAAHSEGLRVFLNDGEMGWTAGPALPNPFLVLDVALGDFDGDGRLDAAAIAHFGGGIGVYLGDGKGSFRRLEESRDILAAAVFGTQVRVADMDGDGFDDIVAATNAGAKVFYTRVDPDSGTLDWLDGSSGLPAPAIGNALRGVIPADITGDGRLELAICALADPGEPHEQRNTVGIYRRGDEGTWTQIDRGLERHLAYSSLAVGDIDRDGNADLVLVASQLGALIYLGDGQGGFTFRGALPETRNATRVALGDANGDGWLDVAVLSGTSKHRPESGGLVVLLNHPELWREEQD